MPAPITSNTVETLVNIAKIRATAKIKKPILFLILPLPNFNTALIINIHTATRIQFRACCTMAKLEKFVIKPAIILIMMMDGVTTPRVAAIAPGTPAW